jgi:tRNA-dihydrouridine synthase
LDGFAIGRAAFGKPWIFNQDTEYSTQNSVELLKEVILRHAELCFETKGLKGMMEFRKHLLCYLKGFPNAKEMRTQAVKITSPEEVKEVVEAAII